MQGWPVFEPMTRILIDLESFRPDDHLLRDVDRLVEPALVHKLTACCCAEGKGRPSIDSFVYFRMQRVAYLYGIDSGRRLCEDVYCNLAYRWFCRLSNAHARPGVPADDVGADVEERTVIRRGQTEPRLVSGTGSRAFTDPNPS